MSISVEYAAVVAAEPRPWATPEGAYAIIALLVLGAIGAMMAPGGLREPTRRSRRLIAAAVLVGAALSIAWPRITGRDAVVVVTGVRAADLVSRWSDGPDTLTLLADGRYECRGVACTGVGPAGTWSVSDDGTLVARWSDGHAVPWRVVQYHGRQRLGLAPPPGSGATWDGQLTFERVTP